MSEEQKVSQSGEPQLVSFRAYPIETAPKSRDIMLFAPDGCWYRGYWSSTFSRWASHAGAMPDGKPTHWAELSEMVPTSEPGSTKAGDSLPASWGEAEQRGESEKGVN